MTTPAESTQSPVAAFFDVDGTLTKTTLLHPLSWFQRAHLSPWRYQIWLAGLIFNLPRYVWIDHRSRSRFNQIFFRRYGGMNSQELRQWHRTTFAENMQRVLFPAAAKCIQEHQSRGHRIVLVTGGLDFVILPLAEYLRVDHVLAMRLSEREGRFTGELALPPLADAEKAVQMRALASAQGIDLAASHAYGNSWGDVPMLECVGHPTAVNPDGRLRALANQRGWPSVTWNL